MLVYQRVYKKRYMSLIRDTLWKTHHDCRSVSEREKNHGFSTYFFYAHMGHMGFSELVYEGRLGMQQGSFK